MRGMQFNQQQAWNRALSSLAVVYVEADMVANPNARYKI